MKRIICLIIAFMLYAACASADRYLDASFSFSGLADYRIESIELYEQENRITGVSTFIPEYAFITDQTMDSSLSLFHSICSLNPGTIRKNVQTLDKQIHDMIGPYLSEPVPGVYSGELFENAVSVRTACFQLSELLTMIFNTLDSSDEPFMIVCKATFSSLIQALQHSEPGQDLFTEIKIYDDWQYISALVFDQEKAVLTISSDLSSSPEKRLLIHYSENGRSFFRDILFSDEREAIILTASLRSGSKSTYQQVMKDRPLTAALLTITDEHFEFELDGNGLSEPLMLTGKPEAQDNGEAQLIAKVFIGNHDEQAIDISISLSQMARPVNFSDKETVSLSDQKENAGFIVTAVSKATELLAEMIPTLPEDYQKMMIKLLYP